MSERMVPNWKLRHQRQEVVVGGEERMRSSHVHNQLQQNPSHVVSLSDYAEITWENGQIAMHGLSGILPTAQTKPTWVRTSETLESIVHQATCHKQDPSPRQENRNPANVKFFVPSSGQKWEESFTPSQMDPISRKKRIRSESDECGRKLSNSFQHERADLSVPSTCASASATFCRDSDTTMMTWASLDSPRSLKTKTIDEASACQDGSENREENETKAEKVRFHYSSSSRRSRAAVVHNMSERRRRDKINQKMKALQKLVPNASKTDKASMLDEVIEYLKQLQAQVQMMSIGTVPQVMMPAAALGMQQQIQMSLLARMGMGVAGLGMNMGMLDMSSMARAAAPQSLPSLIHTNPVAAAAAPAFVPPPFLLPSVIPPRTSPPPNANATANASVPLNDPYCSLLAQSINMELYNKMTALYRQQVNQSMQAAAGSPMPNHIKGE